MHEHVTMRACPNCGGFHNTTLIVQESLNGWSLICDENYVRSFESLTEVHKFCTKEDSTYQDHYQVLIMSSMQGFRTLFH